MYKLFEITTCCGGQRSSQGERAREIERSITPNRKAPENAGRESDSNPTDVGTSPKAEWRGSRMARNEQEEYTMYVTITTNTQTITGYTNGKNYAGTIYINQLNGKEINWKKSIKINAADITSKIEIANPTAKITASTMPKTTAGWMAEMARSEA
jgi:hypothetical protein